MKRKGLYIAVFCFLVIIAIVSACFGQVQVIQDVTATIQAKINSDPDGVIDLDLTPFDGMGATSINVGPLVKSIRINATRPIVFYELPLIKPGTQLSMSRGLFHVDHSTTTPEWILPLFESGPNITYDGMAEVIKDPTVSDEIHDPQGINRPIFLQVGYREGTILKFVWRSHTRNTASSAVKVIETEDGLIEGCRFENGNRHVLGITYKQGTRPYTLRVRNNSFCHVSAPFDLSVPNKTLVRTVTPYCEITGLMACDVWWRTKIHGCWSADIVGLDSHGDGRNGYAGLDIANATIGTIRVRNSHFEGFPSQGITWNHTKGRLELENISFSDCYTPIYPSSVQEIPVVFGGIQIFDDCVTLIRKKPDDVVCQTDTAGMSLAEINEMWNQRMKAAVRSFKAEKLTPTWWVGPMFYPEMRDYAVSLGWNGSTWPQ